MYVFKKYRFLLNNTGLWASKYRFVFPEVGMSDNIRTKVSPTSTVLHSTQQKYLIFSSSYLL